MKRLDKQASKVKEQEFKNVDYIKKETSNIQPWTEEEDKSLKASNKPIQVTKSKTLDKNKPEKTKKLSYKLQKELDESPLLIEQLEKQMEDIQHSLSDSAIYKDEPDRAASLQEELEAVEKQHEQVFERWEELEAML